LDDGIIYNMACGTYMVSAAAAKASNPPLPKEMFLQTANPRTEDRHRVAGRMMKQMKTM
jgi:hypothetical protein